MQAGKLNKRVILQKPVKTQSPTTGAIVSGWADVAELWANVTDLSARDFVAAQAGQNEVSTRITIRWRDDVTDKHRIVHRGRIYDTRIIFTRTNGSNAVSGNSPARHNRAMW